MRDRHPYWHFAAGHGGSSRADVLDRITHRLFAP